MSAQDIYPVSRLYLLVEDVAAVVGVVLPSDEANPGPGALEAQVTHGTRLSRCLNIVVTLAL